MTILVCTSGLGKVSYHAAYSGVEVLGAQIAEIPSCSTGPVPKPSRPTQAEENVPLDPPGDTAQLRNGTKNVAVTFRNLTPFLATAYPAQLVASPVGMLPTAKAAARPAGSRAGIIGWVDSRGDACRAPVCCACGWRAGWELKAPVPAIRASAAAV